MIRFRLVSLVVLAPVMAVLVAAIGCGGGADKGDQQAPRSEGGERKAGGGEKKAKSAGALEELASTGWATLKGKVTYDGDPPQAKEENIDKDKDHCLAAASKERPEDTRTQTWKVDPNTKGVANVIVWLRAPQGKYFKIPDDQKDRSKDVVRLDQPFCAFEPHVVVLNPSYFDPQDKKQKSTGQKFVVRNSAPIAHNTNWTTSASDLNPGQNILLEKKTGDKVDERTIKFRACRDNQANGEQQVNFVCNIHGWMKGYARVFDHPFVAVTRGDQKAEAKDFGSFEIPKVPAGVEVEMVYWHEALGSPKVLKKINLKDGETHDESFKVKQ